MLSDQDRNFIRLVLRSRDVGEGWRKVSPTLWKLVELFKHDELLERDKDGLRVRLTQKGNVVAEYLI